MEPRKLYSIQWTQAYPQYDVVKALYDLCDELIEMSIEEGDCLDEAKAVIAQVMKL